MHKYLNHFFVAIGAIASLLTMVSFFFNIEWSNHLILAWVIIGIIVVVCLGYAWTQTRRKKKIIIPIANNFLLTIRKGNLFDQKGVIVIPVNDYFDTHVGDGIIEPKSVHGQFVRNLFGDRLEELDKKIEMSLKGQNLTGETVQPRINGKSVRYPLGTCAVVKDGGNSYVCLVTTNFDLNNVAHLTRKDLSTVMDGLFDCLETISGSNVVSMPVIGAGHARLNRSVERILHYLVDYFDFSLSERKILGGVQIIIPSLKKINLNRLADIFAKTEM